MSKRRQDSGGLSLNSLLDLRTYDVYTKVEDDFVIKTPGGATLSLIGKK